MSTPCRHEGEVAIYVHPFLTSELDRVWGQRNASAVQPPGKNQYPFNRKLGGPQTRS